MAMTLHLTDDELEALRQCAQHSGISMQDAARLAIREFIVRSEPRSQVRDATDLILSVHADAIERLGR